jgi:uncharacterized protein YjiS (DUF1127 family)
MHTITSFPRLDVKRPRLADGLRTAARALCHRLAAWRRNREALIALDHADPRMLADLGISPAQAEFELDRTTRLYQLR